MSLPTPYYEDKERGIVIYNADCRDILEHLPKVDLLLTDPPYGVKKDYATYDDSQSVDWIVETLMGIDAPKLITPGVNNIWKYPPADWVIGWFKPNSMSRSCIANANVWEPILVYGCKNFGVDGISVSIVPQRDTGDHPCPKPVALFKWLLHRQKHETVLDPFMGSGTTLVACKQLGRKCIGIDISLDYCRIAVQRLSQDLLFDSEELAQL